MGQPAYAKTELWKKLKAKSKNCDDNEAFLNGVQRVCSFAINRAKMIVRTFPLYTLHDETHIINVITLIENILGTTISSISREELATLLIISCCHDIGMSCSEEERQNLLQSQELERYLADHPSEALIAYHDSLSAPQISDSLFQRFLRTIHHLRVASILYAFDWPESLSGKVNRETIKDICQSHGESVDSLRDRKFDKVNKINIRRCAVLLRLADILDFDDSRAPADLFDFLDFREEQTEDGKKSWEEWRKHLGSDGFDFPPNRAPGYEIEFHAECKSIEVEQTVRSFLNWVKEELDECIQLLRRFSSSESNILPSNIRVMIDSHGYCPGEYRFSLDQEHVIALLVGEDLYSEPGVFVRELLQNAFDAVRTRQFLDVEKPRNWISDVHISSWYDKEGYRWFRVDDNGIGMTKAIIESYFLGIGRSYYKSAEFMREKQLREQDEFVPTSQFGIGILSCFMGDLKHNRVELTTKHFRTKERIRMSMSGLSGYYYLATGDGGYKAAAMVSATEAEKASFRTSAGTSIAVRSNLFAVSGKYRNYTDVVDYYIAYPDFRTIVEEGGRKTVYKTANELCSFLKSLPLVDKSRGRNEQCNISVRYIDCPIEHQLVEKLKEDFPNCSFSEPPRLRINIVDLSELSKSDYLKGCVFSEQVVLNANDKGVFFTNGRLGEQLNFVFRVWREYDSVNHSFYYNIHLTLDSADHNVRRTTDATEGVLSNDLSTTGSSYSNSAIKKWYINSNFDEFWYDGLSWDIRIDLSAFQKETGIENLAQPIIAEMLKRRRYDAVSYNGISCETELSMVPQDIYAQDFASPLEKSLGIGKEKPSDYGSIILLSDKYRPRFRIDRSLITSLPIEAACNLELVNWQLYRSGFETFGVLSQAWRLLPKATKARAYWQLFQSNRALSDMIQSQITPYKIDAPNSLRHSSGIESIFLCGEEYTKAYYSRYDGLVRYNEFIAYNMLIIAFLQKDNCIFAVDNEPTGLGIRKLNPQTDTQIVLGEFPPGFFVHPSYAEIPDLFCYDDSNLTCLYGLGGLNIEHPFSKFLLENYSTISKYIPGILRDLINSILNCCHKDATVEIVEFIDRIERIGDELQLIVPANLKEIKNLQG